MLSRRACNILKRAGFDLKDTESTKREVMLSLMNGVRWRNCGKKTIRELEQWANEGVGMIDMPRPCSSGSETGISKVFLNELTHLINRHSVENVADVPDFILAEMICRMIEAMGPSIKKALDWHGADSVCHPLLQHPEEPPVMSDPHPATMDPDDDEPQEY